MIPEYVSEEDTLSRSILDSSRSSSPKGAGAASSGSSLNSSRSNSPINKEGIDPKIIKHYLGFSSLDKIYKFLNEVPNDKDFNVAIIDQGLTNLKLNVKHFT